MKLAPKGKVGGLGYLSKNLINKKLDPSLPNNPLYRNFVRQGSCIGQYHKKKFDDLENSVDDESENGKVKKNHKKNKKNKKYKKPEEMDLSVDEDDEPNNLESIEIEMESHKKHKKNKKKNKLD